MRNWKWYCALTVLLYKVQTLTESELGVLRQERSLVEAITRKVRILEGIRSHETTFATQSRTSS